MKVNNDVVLTLKHDEAPLLLELLYYAAQHPDLVQAKNRGDVVEYTDEMSHLDLLNIFCTNVSVALARRQQ